MPDMMKMCIRDRSYPPCGIGREFIAFGIIKFVYSLYQPEIAFLDKVKEQHASADISLGNAYYQPEVCLT